MLTACHLSVDDLKKEVLDYTLGLGQQDPEYYKNERYRKSAARATLYFHNLVIGTYHRERHRLVANFLERTSPRTFMDIGYGVPGAFIADYLQRHATARAVLLDQDPSAEEFSKAVLGLETPEILSRISFGTYDMDTQTYPGDADCYLMLDSIEHTRKPTEYLAMLISRSPKDATFIFSIPICPLRGLEGFHFMEWLTDAEARGWLTTAGLVVLDDGIAQPNPAVDFFAELNFGSFYNYLALCRKA